eukprot:408208-Prymnesium_polylepis.1
MSAPHDDDVSVPLVGHPAADCGQVQRDAAHAARRREAAARHAAQVHRLAARAGAAPPVVALARRRRFRQGGHDAGDAAPIVALSIALNPCPDPIFRRPVAPSSQVTQTHSKLVTLKDNMAGVQAVLDGWAR